MSRTKHVIALICIATSLSLTACGANTDSTLNDLNPALQAELGVLDALGTEVESLAAGTSCATVDNCAALPMGAKPCGGPQSYLAYCSTDIAANTVEEGVDDYTIYENDINNRYDLTSDCTLVEEPITLQLVDGECTIP